MRTVQCIILENDKVAVGFIEETERFYEVEGFYIAMELTDDVFGNAERKGSMVYNPFSPVGSLVQKVKFPASKVSHYQALPDTVLYHLTFALSAETRNIARRKHLEGMRVPSRTGISPDEALALNSQYLKKHGVLPQGKLVNTAMQTIAGTFDTLATSPYREDV